MLVCFYVNSPHYEILRYTGHRPLGGLEDSFFPFDFQTSVFVLVLVLTLVLSLVSNLLLNLVAVLSSILSSINNQYIIFKISYTLLYFLFSLLEDCRTQYTCVVIPPPSITNAVFYIGKER